MGIDLRGGDAFMSQHFLHCTKVGTAFYQMRGEGMAEGMR